MYILFHLCANLSNSFGRACHRIGHKVFKHDHRLDAGLLLLIFYVYDHGFRMAKASFLAELGLVLRSKIAIAPMAKATKRV